MKIIKTKYCTKCKTMYSDKLPSDFCPKCGNELEITVAFQDNYHIVQDATILSEEPYQK